jgi:hypothetical protein
MFEPIVAFREWLIGAGSITALVPAGHIAGGDLPQGANPGAGEKWITFHVRGGAAHSEIRDIIYPSFAITFWAARDKILDARAVYAAFRDLSYSTSNLSVAEAMIVAAEEEVIGQDVTDPSSEWSMCVTYYRVTMRANS